VHTWNVTYKTIAQRVRTIEQNNVHQKYFHKSIWWLVFFLPFCLTKPDAFMKMLLVNIILRFFISLSHWLLGNKYTVIDISTQTT
jgi:hypothetical protein